MLPLAHASGRAGNNFTSSSASCTSIFTMPLTRPKFPSIWKGGWLSKRLGRREIVLRSPICRSASFPSPSLAYRLIIQARLQPVCPPPFSSLFSSVFRAASISSGVLYVIPCPGISANRCEMCLCPGSVSRRSSDHSAIRPSSVILTGLICGTASLTAATTGSSPLSRTSAPRRHASNSSFIIMSSIDAPRHTQPFAPDGRIYSFSGETVGYMVRYPSLYTPKSRRNSAASSMVSKCSRRNSRSRVYS